MAARSASPDQDGDGEDGGNGDSTVPSILVSPASPSYRDSSIPDRHDRPRSPPGESNARDHAATSGSTTQSEALPKGQAGSVPDEHTAMDERTVGVHQNAGSPAPAPPHAGADAPDPLSFPLPQRTPLRSGHARTSSSSTSPFSTRSEPASTGGSSTGPRAFFASLSSALPNVSLPSFSLSSLVPSRLPGAPTLHHYDESSVSEEDDVGEDYYEDELEGGQGAAEAQPRGQELGLRGLEAGQSAIRGGLQADVRKSMDLRIEQATDGPTLVSDTPTPSAPGPSSSSAVPPTLPPSLPRSPTASSAAFEAASASGQVHPLTLHAIARRDSEGEAVRIVRERAETERRRDREDSVREAGEMEGRLDEGEGGAREVRAEQLSESPPQMSDREGQGVSGGRGQPGQRADAAEATARPGGARARDPSSTSFAPMTMTTTTTTTMSDRGSTTSSVARGSVRRKGGGLKSLFSRTRTASHSNLAGASATAGGAEQSSSTPSTAPPSKEVPLSPLSQTSSRDGKGRTPSSSAASTRSGAPGAPSALTPDKRETIVEKGIKIARPKVKAKGKSYKDFAELFLAQELVIPAAPSPHLPRADSDPPDLSLRPDNASHKSGGGADEAVVGAKKRKAVWALKFSEDGKYLAVGGKDGVVRVWEVLSTPADREAALDGATTPRDSHANSPDSPSTSRPLPDAAPSTTSSGRKGKKARPTQFTMPVFGNKPLHEYRGHEADVLDLSWSKNNFLLSSSMDKTVRLWHVSRNECLCAFQHLDFVTSIAFHPKDDRFFLSGSLDCKLRLWNIPEKRVHIWTELPELITAVSFTRDGKLAIAGTFVGAVMFFLVETFQYYAQVAAKSSRGKASKGKKVTSLAPFPLPSSTGERLLVTTNDSRLRLYHTEDKIVETTYSGHENASSQIRASFSDDGRWIISGSEDRHVYLWESGLDPRLDGGYHLQKRGKESPHEHFPMPAHIVTAAIFAPTSTRTHLTAALDPVFADGHTHMAPLSRTFSGASLGLVGTETRNTTFSQGAVGSELDMLVPVTSRDGVTVPAGGAVDAILVVADDETGVISIFRNSELKRKRSSIWGRTRTIPAR